MNILSQIKDLFLLQNIFCDILTLLLSLLFVPLFLIKIKNEYTYVTHITIILFNNFPYILIFYLNTLILFLYVKIIFLIFFLI